MKSLLISLFIVLAYMANADVITLSTGGKYVGAVLQTNEQEVLLLADYGTVRFKSDWIKSIVIETNLQPKISADQTTRGAFLPSWREVVSKLAKCSWASNIRQIPASVIDQEILKYVPYLSFSCAKDCEVNIYGDLDNPAGVEIGLYNELADKEYAKKNALEFITQLPLNHGLVERVKNLKWNGDKVSEEGITMEVTLPSAPDAFGGWWISIYSETALNGARSSKSEIETISEPIRKLIKIKEPVKSPAQAQLNSWNREDLAAVRRISIPVRISPNIRIGSTRTNEPVSPSSGQVYVGGYYRKDGTYVRSYTRSRKR